MNTWDMVSGVMILAVGLGLLITFVKVIDAKALSMWDMVAGLVCLPAGAFLVWVSLIGSINHIVIGVCRQ